MSVTLRDRPAGQDAAVAGSREETGESAAVPVVAVLGILASARAGLDARLIEAVTVVTLGVGRHLLSEKGFHSPDQLSAAQRRAWRAEVKRVAAAEVQVTLGVGVVESRQLVGLATAPQAVSAPVVGALDRGEVAWPQVREFWRRCAALPVETAALVSETLFGTDASTAPVERLEPDDTLRDHPWHHADFQRALEREAVRAEGVDVVAERERRRVAYRDRRAHLTVDQDGTGTLVVTGPLTTLCAVHARVDRASRLLRKHGDPRTLEQLRADVAAALLLHGELPLPDGSSDDDLTVVDLEHISRVVNALPAVSVQVVVPWETLGGESPPAVPVARLLGRHPAFLSPGHARELALAPGTTLHRLLVDPADGRLVERSLTTYRPDAAMRRQIVAADVGSRAPGSSAPTDTCEIDHVVPWLDPGSGPGGGATSETNLVCLDKGSHQLKTLRRWSCALTPARDLTWTTLLGQSARTRVHDYRQYLDRVRAAVDDVADGTNVDDRRDLACRVLHAALTHRGPSSLLQDTDDVPGAEEHGGYLYSWLAVRHHGRDGARRPGADRESVPTPESLLGLQNLPWSRGWSGHPTSSGRPAAEPTPPF